MIYLTQTLHRRIANHLPLETIHYTPYGVGEPTESLHGFTGEPTDTNGLVHLRARYYDPALGVFPSLDPMEGNPSQPLSLARYAYVQGNPINAVDPSGLFGETPGGFDSCFNFPVDPGESCNQCPEGWEVITNSRCLSRPDCSESFNRAVTNRDLRQSQSPIVMCIRLGSVAFEAREDLFNRADMPDPCSDRYPEPESLFGPLLDVLGLSGAAAVLECANSGKIDNKIAGILRDGWTANGIILGGELSNRLAFGAAPILLADGSGRCRSFSSFEYGIGGGVDPVQVSLASIYTTAELRHFEGETINISGDIGIDIIPGLNMATAFAPVVAKMQIPLGASMGISISTDGKCNLSFYFTPIGNLFTISITRGLTYETGNCDPNNANFDKI